MGNTFLQVARLYEQSGYRIMPEIDLSYVEEIEGKTFIKWFEEILDNTDITIEVSFDGGNIWHECTNGGEIPTLIDGLDVSTTTMLVRQTLESDGVRTPIFKPGTQIDITGPKDSVVSFSEIAE